MKNLLSTKYSDAAFNVGLFLVRVFFGIVLMGHGFQKITSFNKLKYTFMNFMNLGSTTSLTLIIFAEFFCGFLLIIGMLTRLAAIPVIIGMAVVFFVVSGSDLWGIGERGGLYMALATLLLLCGAGQN